MHPANGLFRFFLRRVPHAAVPSGVGCTQPVSEAVEQDELVRMVRGAYALANISYSAG